MTTGPDHVHPRQEERFEVLSGKLGVRVEGVERVLGEGEGITAPAGSAHAAWNAGEAQVHALIDEGWASSERSAREVEENPNNRNPVSPGAGRPTARGSAVRTLMLAGATLTTGLIAGVFYAYAVSVNLGLAAQPDAAYVATMQAINDRIRNPLFFLSFFGAVLFLTAALVVYSPRPRSGRFWLVALACLLYVGGGFLLTVFVNVPLNEQLARVGADATTGQLARARVGYEGPWNFWNGVRAVFSSLAFLTLVGACLLREERR